MHGRTPSSPQSEYCARLASHIFVCPGSFLVCVPWGLEYKFLTSAALVAPAHRN